MNMNMLNDALRQLKYSYLTCDWTVKLACGRVLTWEVWRVMWHLVSSRTPNGDLLEEITTRVSTLSSGCYLLFLYAALFYISANSTRNSEHNDSLFLTLFLVPGLTYDESSILLFFADLFRKILGPYQH